MECDWAALAPELLLVVCEQLPYRSLATVRGVCTAWKTAVKVCVDRVRLVIPPPSLPQQVASLPGQPPPSKPGHKSKRPRTACTPGHPSEGCGHCQQCAATAIQKGQHPFPSVGAPISCSSFSVQTSCASSSAAGISLLETAQKVRATYPAYKHLTLHFAETPQPAVDWAGQDARNAMQALCHAAAQSLKLTGAVPYNILMLADNQQPPLPAQPAPAPASTQACTCAAPSCSADTCLTCAAVVHASTSAALAVTAAAGVPSQVSRFFSSWPLALTSSAGPELVYAALLAAASQGPLLPPPGIPALQPEVAYASCANTRKPGCEPPCALQANSSRAHPSSSSQAVGGSSILRRLQCLTSFTITPSCGLPLPSHLAVLTSLAHLQVLDLRAPKNLQVSTEAVVSRQVCGYLGDEHMSLLALVTSLRELHLSHLHQVSGPAVARLAALSGLTSLSLVDALDGHRVQAQHLQSLAGSLVELKHLALGRITGLPNPMADPPAEYQPWGTVLASFSGLQTLDLQTTHCLEKQVLEGVCTLDHFSKLCLEVHNIPCSELGLGLEVATTIPTLTRLTITTCMLYDSHLELIGQLSQVKVLQLNQVDVRTRDPHGWTALCNMSQLESFCFEEWNNPVLSAGNLCVLTDKSLAMMAGRWAQLASLEYRGKVQLTEKAEAELARMSKVVQACVQGTDGTTCYVSRSPNGSVVQSVNLPYAKLSSRNGYVTSLDSDDVPSDGSENSVNWCGERDVTSEYDAEVSS